MASRVVLRRKCHPHLFLPRIQSGLLRLCLSHPRARVCVLQRDVNDSSTKTGMLFLVDLAGSEMVKKTHATGKVRKTPQDVGARTYVISTPWTKKILSTSVLSTVSTFAPIAADNILHTVPSTFFDKIIYRPGCGGQHILGKRLHCTRRTVDELSNIVD